MEGIGRGFINDNPMPLQAPYEHSHRMQVKGMNQEPGSGFGSSKFSTQMYRSCDIAAFAIKTFPGEFL